MSEGVKISIFDSHCHLEQSDDPEELIKKCLDSGIGLITSSARIEDLDFTLKLANDYPIYFTLGLHPLFAANSTYEQIDLYISEIKKIKNPNFVGIGECGLDFFLIKDSKLKEKSRDVFIKFIKLANELNKPIIIHCREAYLELLSELKKELRTKAVFHYFNQPDFAKEIIDKKWFLSLPFTLSKSKILRLVEEIGIETLLDHILIETDSPILLNNKEITPLDIIEFVEKIHNITGIAKEKIIEKTTKNTKEVFSI